MRTLTAIFLDVKNGSDPQVIELKDDIQEFYKFIGCDAVDIVTRSVNGKKYTIICDDLGLYDENLKTSALSLTRSFPSLVGNLLITGNVDNFGELTSLTKNDVKVLTDENNYVTLASVAHNNENNVTVHSALLLD